MTRFISILGVLAAAVCIRGQAQAHCDTTKGPVVAAARAALEQGDVNLVLHWVRADDEPAVRSAFEEARAVRGLGPQAQRLADRHFFETVVRIHRAGEGAAYTGLTDADPEPFVVETDAALKTGSVAELENSLVTAVRTGLANRFDEARGASDFKAGDVAHGRAFVAAYVPLVHWVEGVANAATTGGSHAGAGTGSPHPSHAAAGESAGAGGGGTPAGHLGGALQALPWILAGALALAALVEGAFLWRRRFHAPA